MMDVNEIWESMTHEQKLKALKAVKESYSIESLESIKKWAEQYDYDNTVDQIMANVGAEIIFGAGRDLRDAMKGKDGISGSKGMAVVAKRLRTTADKMEAAGAIDRENMQ